MTATRPNVMLVVCHDLGRCLGCYGRRPIATPHIDRLASDGALFSNGFCTAPSCSPSRGSLMTGRYPHSNGLMGLVNLGWTLPEREWTLPQILRSQGYSTALFGIQHERPQMRASSLGYDIVVPPAPAPELAPQVADFIRAVPSEPFFLSVGTFEPHRPFHAQAVGSGVPVIIPAYLPDNTIVREEMAGFTRLVHELDDAMGVILQALDRARLTQHTLVVFTTDHGIDMPRAKGTLYDPGIETALIMRWPGWIPAGARFGDLVSNVDLLPTLLDALGIGVPCAVQGRSLWPLIRGEPHETRNAIFAGKTHHTAYDPMRCIRTRTHKYIHNFGDLRHYEIPADSEMDCLAAIPDLIRARRPLAELYDLVSDPLELSNVAGLAESLVVERQLRDELREWMAATGDPLLDGAMPIPKLF